MNVDKKKSPAEIATLSVRNHLIARIDDLSTAISKEKDSDLHMSDTYKAMLKESCELYRHLLMYLDSRDKSFPEIVSVNDVIHSDNLSSEEASQFVWLLKKAQGKPREEMDFDLE